jgi:hypothetical protein
MNEEKIEEIKNSLRTLAQQLIARGKPLSNEMKENLLQVLKHAESRIAQLRQEEKTAQVTPVSQIPRGADLLWILAGGQREPFINYLRTFPDPELNALARNPSQLRNVLERLESQVTLPAGEVSDGIPKADLQSSNVYGFSYNPREKRLFIKFNGKNEVGDGPVYEYEGVPPAIFKIFRAGAIPAKTKGSNKWGSWWQGKNPSLGAAMNALIKLGGYPYQQVA